MRERDPADVRHLRQSLAILAALLPAIAAAQTWSADLEWQHDGVNVGSFRAYAGRTPSSLSQTSQVLNPAARGMSVDGLAGGVWYFAVTAVAPSPNTAESARSNVACVALGSGSCAPPVAELPGAVRNLVVNAVAVPAVTVSLTAAPEAPAWNEWFLTISAASSVQISANGSTRFDWVRQGAAPGGAGGTAIATTPALGSDEDGVLAQSIALNGPINGARADFDGAAFTGAQITVSGITKALVPAGATWSASFP